MREGLPSQPSPEREPPKIIPEYRVKMQQATEAGDVSALVTLIQELNKQVLIESGFSELSEFDERQMQDVQNQVAEYVEDAKEGWGKAVISMSDGAWTRMILSYNRFETEKFSLFVNPNNARKKVFETWKKMGGET